MVQSNKILTVSYGTFSCTLEGFEDSFETMKAIAEYFRDLAADDRYFGAEPPQPDAEMLARIAEREIARQVEARRESGGIVLRAAQSAATPASLATVGRAPAQDAVAQPAEAEPAEAEPVAEPVRRAAQAPRVPVEVIDVADDTADEEPVVETAEVAEPVAEDAEEISWPEPEAEIVPAADSIAAKLQRIRAVVSRNEMAGREIYSEDEHAETVTPDAPAETVMHVSEDEVPTADFPTTDEDEEADEVAALLDRLETRFDVTEDDEVEDAFAGAPEHDDTDAVIARITAVQEDEDEFDDEIDDEDEPATDHAEEEPDDFAKLAAVLAPADVIVAEAVAEPDTRAADQDDDEDDLRVADAEAERESLFGDFDDDEDELDDEFENLLDDEDDKDEPVRRQELRHARLVKVKRSDFEAAVAAGQLEEVDDEDEAAQAGSLSAEDEADLMRELAEVEAELAAGASVAGEAVRGSLNQMVDEETSDLSRLMDEVGTKLSDPDAAARHETYSHMRAAVATTKAERSAGGTMGSHPSDDPYRDDLASVVRPRRPEAVPTRPLRPTTEPRQAPLKLVAELRVDDGAGIASRGPVRPRRVTTQVLDEPQVAAGATTQEGGFAEFAAEMGATELPDLLEAAAAYLSFVEGREQFSRPQLMSKVRQVEPGEFNREDGLRSFGQLLRDGKIEKKGGGRFAASGRIGFRPDERAAG